MKQLLAIGPFSGILLMGIGMRVLWGGYWRSYIGFPAPWRRRCPSNSRSTNPNRKPAARSVFAVSVIVIFCHAADFTSRSIIPIVQSAYEPSDEPTGSVVRTLQEPPFVSRIQFAPPNQDLAALSGHDTLMDFSPLRQGCYLPVSQAEAARSTPSMNSDAAGSDCRPG